MRFLAPAPIASAKSARMSSTRLGKARWGVCEPSRKDAHDRLRRSSSPPSICDADQQIGCEALNTTVRNLARRHGTCYRLRPEGFIEPCIPAAARVPPTGPSWLHEIKHDGYRPHGAPGRPQGAPVLPSRSTRWSDRFPRIGEALARLRTRSATIDRWRGGTIPRRRRGSRGTRQPLDCSRLAAPSRRSLDHLGKALDRVALTSVKGANGEKIADAS